MIDNNKYENGLSSRQASVRVRDGVKFLLIGGGIGAVLALLFAPKSGSELRGEIADVTRKGYDATLEKAEKIKTQSTEAFETAKKKAEQVYDFAATKLNAGNTAVSEAVSTVNNAIADGLDDINEESKVRVRHAAGGRNPASIF